MTGITVVDAPSNLGLGVPEHADQPGCAWLPRALRSEGIVERCRATDGGSVPAPAYGPTSWSLGDGVRFADEIGRYTELLADRVGALVEQGTFPLVLGGDCSILLGPALALRRRGRCGLVALDGPDFRHEGNSPYVGGAAGESLALVTGRGTGALTDLEHRSPYVADHDVVLVGMRDDEEWRDEIETTFTSWNVGAVVDAGEQEVVRHSLQQLSGTDGFWLHFDADVLDPACMPAVDSPEPGGLDWEQAGELLAGLVASPRCLGMDVTIYDPLLDPDGSAGRGLTTLLGDALEQGFRNRT